MAVPTKLISTTIGFQDPKGVVVASGLLVLTLSQNAEVISGGGQVVNQPIFLALDVNGKITNTAIWFNDELSPATTVYRAQLYGSNGMTLIQDFGFWSISGASADLSAMVPASVGVSYAGAVLLTPTGSQVITTGNLTLTTGSFIESANAATGTGGLVRKTSPALTTPDIGVAAGTSLALGGGTALATTNRTGTGNLVLQTSPTLVTPVLGVATATSVGGLTISKQIFTGNGTFTVPTGVLSAKFTIVGGGGGGGGASAVNNGGGGGGGGVAIKWLTGLTPGNTIAVTIGTGGTGVSAANGNAGNNSTIASGTQTITTVTAIGGGGGFTGSASSAGGAGAAVSTNGDINGAGTPGQNSLATNVGGGGGSTFLGGGGNPAGGGAGNAAIVNTGSGGSGAGAAGNAAGGNGAAGIVIVEWTI